MKFPLLPLVILGAAVGVAAAPATADDSGFRCGSRLVAIGDLMHEVRKRCGEPDSAHDRRETRKVKVRQRRYVDGVFAEVSEEREVEVRIDEWVYDLGPRRFVRLVAFENGRVTAVSAGEYGTRDQR